MITILLPWRNLPDGSTAMGPSWQYSCTIPGGRAWPALPILSPLSYPYPDILNQLNAVLFAELGEGESQVLQILVYAADRLTAGSNGKALVTALGSAPVTVDVVALVLGLQQLAELLELLLHLQKSGDLQDVLLGLEGLDYLAVLVFVVAVELGAVVGDAAELLHIVDGVVRGHAHDCAHLIAAAVEVRGPALAAYTVTLLQNAVILIALLLQIHTCGKPGRAAANYAYAGVLVHFYTSV